MCVPFGLIDGWMDGLGLGGHLHNLGVVLWEGGAGMSSDKQDRRPVLSVPVLTPSLAAEDRELFVQLLLLLEKHSIWDCGLLHHHSMLHRGLNRPILTGKVHCCSLSDAGMLLGNRAHRHLYIVEL